MSIAAGVVGDDGVAAAPVLTTRNMPAESRRAAALDGAHHLQLGQAHMAAVGVTPSGPVVAEDIRDLQSRTGHVCRLSRWLVDLGLRQGEPVERTHHHAKRVGGDLGIARGRVELGVTEQNLDDPDVGVVLE